jgi:hypothetical protein
MGCGVGDRPTQKQFSTKKKKFHKCGKSDILYFFGSFASLQCFIFRISGVNDLIISSTVFLFRQHIAILWEKV